MNPDRSTPTTAGEPAAAPHGSSRRAFLYLFALGLLGVAAVVPATIRTIEAVRALPGAPQVPLGLAVAAALFQSALITAAFVALGLWAAPRVGLRSHVAERARRGTPVLPALRGEVPLAVLVGAAVGVVMLLVDSFTIPYLDAEWTAAAREQLPRTIGFTVMGMLYGGITEELWMRWGLVSFLAWLGWRLAQGGRGRPGAAVMWTAIVLAAVLFGVGHLPAAATIAALSPLIVARVIVLNAVGGILFGWLYWRRSLEAAMIAHASVHVVVSAVVWAGLGALVR
jgi:hypothetical protein